MTIPNDPNANADTSLVPLWRPSPERITSSRLSQFANWLKTERGLAFENYDALWSWSISDLDAFWQAIADFHGVVFHSPYDRPLSERKMPGAVWFKGATLNFTEHVFRQNRSGPAIIYRNESGERLEWSWPQLEHRVADLAQQLRDAGVVQGDRVVAYLPNTPDAMAACLATVCIGAIWSVCAPDMGKVSVLDRFKQIEPKVLIACEEYVYGGKLIDRRALVEEILTELPTVKAVIRPQLPRQFPDKLVKIQPDIVPFEHPIWIVFSSGTTGLPKPIVHSQGGVLLELLITLLMSEVGPSERQLVMSSTGWIVWNCHLGGLLVGATPCLYDGNPGTPDLNTLWRYCADEGVTNFGAGAAFHTNCMKANLTPGKNFDLSKLRTIGSTGSPLPPEAYQWLYGSVKSDLFLSVVSGGTDFSGGFITGNANLPIYSGEMQSRCLGHAVYAFNEEGQAVIDEVGELVCVEPLPSMPLIFGVIKTVHACVMLTSTCSRRHQIHRQ